MGKKLGGKEAKRRAMVAEVRAGASMRAVARAHAVSLSTVQWWVRRASDRPLDPGGVGRSAAARRAASIGPTPRWRTSF